MTRPLVSVLITAYNCENVIGSAINSLFAQTYRQIELIVVDDGSTDNTAKLLKDFAASDRRVKVFFPGRLGRARALNYGLFRCKGKYVAINDADDISLPERIEMQTDFLESNPETVLVGCKMFIHNCNNGLRTSYTDEKRPLEDDAIRNYFFTGQPIQHSAVLVRKDALYKVSGYNEKIEFLLDRDIFIKLACIGKLYNLNEYLISLGRGDHQFFKNTYKGQKRLKLDFYYRLMAANTFNASWQTKIHINILRQWSLLSNRLRTFLNI